MGTIKGNDTAVVFSEAVQDGQTVNLKSYFKPHMHQQLGRLYNVVDSNHPAYGLRFSAAVQYDRDEMDRFTATTVWGATIAGHYPTGTKPSDILDAIYGGTNEDFFAYVFHKNANGTSSTVPALESVVSNYMKTTLGMIKVDVYQDLNTVVDVRNGVICALLSTGYAPNWPSETYQCAHPFNPDSLESGIRTNANVLTAAEKTFFGNSGVLLFVMRSAADYSSYFSENFPNGTVGVLGASNVANVTFPAHAAAFRYIDEGGTALVDRKTYMSGTIVHELGHLMDRLNNNVTQNPNSTFNQQLALDIADFNATGATPWAVACFNKIDQFLPAPSRVCGNFSSGTALWVVLQSAPAFTATPLEIFAYAYQRGNGTPPPFIQDIQGQLTHVNTYMVGVHNNATP